MTKKLKTHAELLKYLLTLRGKNSQIKKLLLSISDQEVKVLGEIAGNILYGAIPLSDLSKKALKPFKSSLFIISSPKTGSKRRRAVLVSKPNLISKLLEASNSFLKTVLP